MLNDQLRITGGRKLTGTVPVGGSKNASLPIMAAAILTDEPLHIERVPKLTDVDTLGEILRSLGVEVKRDKNNCLRLHTVDPSPTQADFRLVRRMRAGFCVLGPLLTRRGRAAVPMPGGCSIGPRPVDLHLAGLTALGADIKIEHGYVIARAQRLIGSEICMSGPRGSSVTGTANLLCAAVLARGETIIRGAALEPEIVDLGRFLTRMGARIDGLGTSTIRVNGVEQLGSASQPVIPDRIEAATLLLAIAITGSQATVTGLMPEHMASVLEALDRVGCCLQVSADSVTLSAPGRLRATDITAEPYPGMPTDIQAQWMALLATADGRSVVCDHVFPGRFMHVAELNRLSAKIRQLAGEGLCGAAVVNGVERLSGAAVTATDLRASAALVLAGLAAEGQTEVLRAEHLDRGYERLDRKLAALGAEIRRL